MMDALKGKRILVVEDEYLIASDIKSAIEQRGGEVIGPAPRLSAGLALARAEALDAAVIDINLDQEFAVPIARQLAARGIPYVVVTGYDGTSLPGDLRAAPRLTKPFVSRGLTDLLAEMVPVKG